tara:strand:- start:6161 stop:6301 length:141 start_codon:yes stop_codon:yes gene_type:complete
MSPPIHNQIFEAFRKQKKEIDKAVNFLHGVDYTIYDDRGKKIIKKK